MFNFISSVLLLLYLRARAPTPRVITATQLLPTVDMHILIRDLITAPISTQDIVISSLRDNPSSNVLELDILNQHSVSGYSGRAAVEVVLLDVYPDLLDIG